MYIATIRYPHSMHTEVFDNLIASFAKEHDAIWSASGTDTGPPKIRTITYRFDDKNDADDFVKALELRTKNIKGTVRKAPED